VLRIGFAAESPPTGVALVRFGEPAAAVEAGRAVVGLPLPSDPRALREAGAAIVAALGGQRRVAVDARALPAGAVAAMAAGAALRMPAPDLAAREREDPVRLARLTFHVGDPAGAEAAWQAVAPGVAGARLAIELATLPANVLTPKTFAERLSRLPGLDVAVLRRRHLRDAGMGALLGVAQGSVNPPRVVVLRRPGAFAAKPLLLVGKGITFDTGGVSVKPAAGMEEMKADMAGAAAIAGAMLALAQRNSPAPVVAVLGLAENALSGSAQRPGDVVRAADGSTVEIVDTDAEGRLVLADCLAWARTRFDPVAIIDLATLTGANVVALGGHRAGLFASDPALAAAIAAAGEAVAERVWPMPLDAAYAEALESAIADIRHCSAERRQPDACHAAAFLHRFAGHTPWAHLDIAGLEWRSEPDDPWQAGATGFGARLLDRLVAARFEDADGWPDTGH
jgi:leucyl aminopeptidase